jgi:hypothetical protein
MLIKDLIFNQELQDSLSMAAQSKRTGEAKVIAARAEVEAAKRMSPHSPHHHSMLTEWLVMRQAADVLNSAPAMQIRYLETMQAMAKSSNSKVRKRCPMILEDITLTPFRSFSYPQWTKQFNSNLPKPTPQEKDPAATAPTAATVSVSRAALAKSTAKTTTGSRARSTRT